MNDDNTAVTVVLGVRAATIDALAADKGKTRQEMVLVLIDSALALNTMIAKLHKAECGDTRTCEHSKS